MKGASLTRRIGRVLRFDSRLCLVADEEEDRKYMCSLPGKFRTQKIRPIAGDVVEFTPMGSSDGIVNAIRNRRNELSRPRVANIDQVILVTSLVRPAVSYYVVDRFLVLTEKEKLPTVIVINKVDLLNDNRQIAEFRKIYSDIYQVLEVSAKKGKNLDGLKQVFHGRVSAVAGMSGVGKSSILNALNPGLGLRVAEISERLDRGKHTTSSLELLEFSFGGYVADTPGFASLDLGDITPSKLKNYFADLRSEETGCSFRDCIHYEEPDCVIKKMVESGELPRTRYENYTIMLDELRKRRTLRKRR